MNPWSNSEDLLRIEHLFRSLTSVVAYIEEPKRGKRGPTNRRNAQAVSVC